jgi:ribosomal protein L7/L12
MSDHTPPDHTPSEDGLSGGSSPDDLPWMPMPSGPAPAVDPAPKGMKGWLARRAEAMLRKPRHALPALTEPGECQVVLQLVGTHPVTVITVISEATGLDFVSASNLAQDAPAVVVSGISEASAERVVERLEKAGAKAVGGERYRPEQPG